MNSNTLSLKKMALALSAVALTGVMSLAQAASVEGLHLLDRIGEHKGELKTYFAARPTDAELSERSKLAFSLARVNGIAFQQDKPVRLGESRTALISSSDASASFEVDAVTGNFLFNGGMLKYRSDANTRDLPQESDAAALAHQLLGKYGLSVDDRQLKIAHIGGLNLAIADGSGKSEIFEKLKTVRFSRVLDGLAVEGDARIVMHLGESGALAGMVYQWPRLEKSMALSSAMLQKPDAVRSSALDEIKAMTAKSARAELTKASLVLYDDGRGVVEPAYHFEITRYFDDGNLEPVMIPYDFYVPAAIRPLAYYPHMEVAPRKPADGSDERPTDADRNQ